MMKSVSILYAIVAAWGCVACAAMTETARSAMEAARVYGATVRQGDMGWAFDRMYPPLQRLYAEQYSNKTGNEAENARRTMGLNPQRETPEQMKARLDEQMRALKASYVKAGKQMKTAGIRIESYTVREPVAEYVVTPAYGAVRAVIQDKNAEERADRLQSGTERCRLVIVPITLIISATNPRTGNSARIERSSHIYAIRDEIMDTGKKGLTRHRTKLNNWYFADGNTGVSELRTIFPNLPANLRIPAGGDRLLR